MFGELVAIYATTLAIMAWVYVEIALPYFIKIDLFENLFAISFLGCFIQNLSEYLPR
jgi:hypothetical protein